MKYRVVFAPEARDDYRALPARVRAEVRDGISGHLVHLPAQESKSRMKRLRGTRKPQFRLRFGDLRVFYDVVGGEVEVLAIVSKAQASDWLRESGV
jgi:mRNA interferase RelE/StbE